MRLLRIFKFLPIKCIECIELRPRMILHRGNNKIVEEMHANTKSNAYELLNAGTLHFTYSLTYLYAYLCCITAACRNLQHAYVKYFYTRK